ncbi:hypothetical protein B4U80_11147 [Leptotrombidium deliense]|uniref:non-specific serine/threonine protein kinase n=1 Tax=Leptotrombidium deliense TaxID=299467 RepID=A0A443RZZ0_9ACAR|nr:hypothetical protein B4U80_11147 [Leptotrombidium deliense]
MAFQTNVTLDDFELVQKLGEGNFGEVYKAKENNREEHFALKKVISEPGVPIKTLMEEMNILKNLDHKNIIKFFDAGIDGNSIANTKGECFGEGSQIRIGNKKFRPAYLWFRMELCKRSLKDAIEKKETQNLKFRITTVKQIVEALKYLRLKNVAHRDIKPDNILLDVNNVVKLCDFGLARQMLKPIIGSVTTKGDYTYGNGTLWFVAPEILNAGDADKKIPTEWLEKADVYSTGKTWLLMCTTYSIDKRDIEAIVENYHNGKISDMARGYMVGAEQIMLACMLNKVRTKRISVDTLYNEVVENNLSQCQAMFDKYQQRSRNDTDTSFEDFLVGGWLIAMGGAIALALAALRN